MSAKKNTKSPAGAPSSSEPKKVYTLHTLAVATQKRIHGSEQMDMSVRAMVAMSERFDRMDIIMMVEDLVETMALSEGDLHSLARKADGVDDADEHIQTYAMKNLPQLHAAVRKGVAEKVLAMEQKRMREWDEPDGPYFDEFSAGFE